MADGTDSFSPKSPVDSDGLASPARARFGTNVVIRNTFIDFEDEEDEVFEYTRKQRRSKTMPTSATAPDVHVPADEVRPPARPLSPSRPASVYSSVVIQVPDFPCATPQTSRRPSLCQTGVSRRTSRRPSVETTTTIADLEPAHIVPTWEPEASQDPISLPTSPMKLVMRSDIALTRTLTWHDQKLGSAMVASSYAQGSRVLGYVWLLSQDAQGCRLVQEELESSNEEVQLRIAEELRGHIYEALRSPHANFVVRKCVEVIPASELQFIIDELLCVGAFAICEIARNRFGCRIIESLFTHCPSSQLYELAEILIADSSDLCGHMYGNFAIQTLLGYGTEDQKKNILEALTTQVAEFGHRFYALAVYRAGFQIATEEDRARIATALVNNADVLVTMSRYKNGPDFIEEVFSHMDSTTCNGIRAQIAAAASQRQERAAKVASTAPKPKASRFKSNRQQRQPYFSPQCR